MRYSAHQSSSTMNQTIVDAQEHPIEAVTVYQFRAEVRRIIALELKEGRNDFAITNLPSSVIQNTLHVTGLSAGQASIVDTTCVIPKLKTTPASLFGFASAPSNKTAEKLAELKAKKRELLRELSLINARSDVLLEYARSLNGENTQPADFVDFLSQFNAAGQETLEATTRIESAVQDIDNSIKKVNEGYESDDEKDADVSPKRNLKTKASVVISAKEASTVKLTLTYVVFGASWSPTYELYTSTDSKTRAVANSATLHYRASIQQTTGEDWNNVHLTLSTSGSASSIYIPGLSRSLIRSGTTQRKFVSGVAQSMHVPSLFAQPATVAFGASTQDQTSNTTGGGLFSFGSVQPVPPGSTFGSTTATTGGLFGSQTTQPHVHQLIDGDDQESAVFVEPNPELHTLEHVGAEAKDQALASTYSVETNVTVESGDIPHKVTVMTLQLAAKTEYVAVPKMSRSVYLLCKVTNTSTHQLLSGPLVTYLDNSFVDTVHTPLVPVKGMIVKSLGVDTALSTTFKQTRKKADSEYARAFAQKQITTLTDSITLKNARAFSIPRVLIRHAIPVPEDGYRFRVNIKEPEELGQLVPGKELKLRDRVKGRWIDDSVVGADLSGLVEWSIDNVAAGASEEIKVVYEVSAPEDVDWIQT